MRKNQGRMNGVYKSGGGIGDPSAHHAAESVGRGLDVGDSRATALDCRRQVVFESKDQRPSVPEEKGRSCATVGS